MKLNKTLLALATAAAFAAPAHAVDFSGTTAGGPTFNRPFTLTELSGVGTATPYSVLSFSVSAAGSYDLLSTSIGGWDNFALLYQGSFNPASALTNLIAVNDDLNGADTAGFSQALATGTNYFFVTTGYQNTDFGAYVTTITGPGTVVIPTAVPEPSTYLMLALGLAAIGAVARRRGARAA